MDAREEELQIEVERLKAWLHKIGREAWKETNHGLLEKLADDAIRHSSCVCHPEWPVGYDWAPIGKWPPNTLESFMVEHGLGAKDMERD